VVAILITFAPEFAPKIGVLGPVNAGTAVAFCYGGITLGSLASGILSQLWGSRRKVVLLFILGALAGVAAYLSLRGLTPAAFYALSAFLGLATGYWAVFVTIAAEQFGTNLRATVATTVPNFVRGLVPVCTLSFQWARPHLGLVGAAATVSALWFGLALVSAFGLRETFGVDLDYVEAD
jgi:MFS family permease